MRNVRTLIAVIAVFLLVVPAALAQVKPPQTAPVPNVEGRPLSDAQKALVSAGFNAFVTFENVTDPGKNNVVLKQPIAPGYWRSARNLAGYQRRTNRAVCLGYFE